MNRTLALRREALCELTYDELGDVAGGVRTLDGATCPLLHCFNDTLTLNCTSYTCCTASGSC